MDTLFCKFKSFLDAFIETIINIFHTNFMGKSPALDYISTEELCNVTKACNENMP